MVETRERGYSADDMIEELSRPRDTEKNQSYLEVGKLAPEVTRRRLLAAESRFSLTNAELGKLIYRNKDAVRAWLGDRDQSHNSRMSAMQWIMLARNLGEKYLDGAGPQEVTALLDS